MFYWGPSEPLQEPPASFFPPTGSVGSLARQVWIGAWGQGQRERETRNSVPARLQGVCSPLPRLWRETGTQSYFYL